MELLIGEKIKKYRKERDMTQEALAQALSLSPQSVSKWECGDGYPDITLLPAIANFFEVTVDELIGNDEISAREDVQKNYFNIVHSLSYDEQLQLSLRYHIKYPRNWHIATALMYTITRYHQDKLDEYRDLLDEICNRLLRDCSDSTMRKDAIKSMCMICAEDEIAGWLKKDTVFWREDQINIYEERYKLTGEDEKYWMYHHAGNFLHVSSAIGRLREHKSYIGNPQASVDWNTMYLNILDGITQNTIPDGWICEYHMQFCRLAAAYFGLGDQEKGYLYLEKALELNKRWNTLAKESALDLGNELFFGKTKLVKGNYYIALPNGKRLYNFGGVKYDLVPLADIMTRPTGWEWFDAVRAEDRWLSLLSDAKQLTV